ncbi:MAG TPA: WbqC family protein [Chitinophagaceae bacterium]|nr:WbqC family protein [Chitinophagaceae bacterium]
MKSIVITQSNYIPWKGYFDAINIADEFVFYDDMQYTRRDWRNRNKIKTKDGIKWLTVPVEAKGKYFQKINETKVSDPYWGKDHWATLIHNYSKARYFGDYKEIFESLYLNNKELYLSKINYSFIKVICEILGIKTRFTWSSEFDLKEDRTERLVDICKKCDATDYYTGPSAKVYMNETLFLTENINIHYFDYSGYPPYNQLHGDFIHEVSIIDLLFNEGPNASKYLKSFKNYI